VLQVLYPLREGTAVDEQVLEHLEGYRGSRPVRIGNGAAGQFQLDIHGELLAAADQIVRLGGTVDAALWSFLARVADECCARWREPDEGIWEVRGPPRHFVHSKLMAWVALDRVVRMASRYGLPGPLARWRRERAAIRADILAHGYDPDVGAFVQAYGAPDLDASTLVVPMIGFLPPDDLRVLGTIDRVYERLVVDGFVERYDTRGGVDGLPPGEGAFGLVTCWMVDALALAGRVDEAHALLERLAGCANHVGLLAEQVEPGTRVQMGNFPQAFTHLGIINSVLYLASAEHRRTPGPPPLGAEAAGTSPDADPS
jgi:GH15 family glucan-1,4-alpha-glucosidase